MHIAVFSGKNKHLHIFSFVISFIYVIFLGNSDIIRDCYNVGYRSCDGLISNLVAYTFIPTYMAMLYNPLAESVIPYGKLIFPVIITAVLIFYIILLLKIVHSKFRQAKKNI